MMRPTGHFLLLFACLAWGGSYAVGRFGLNDGSALWLTLWRWGPGAIGFAVYLALTWRRHEAVLWRNLSQITLIALLGIVVYPVTLFAAVAETTALNASLYLAATPVLIALASTVAWGERLGPLDGLAIVLGLAGALVLIFEGRLDRLASFQVASSDLWAIISALAWAGYCVALPLKPQDLEELPFLAALVVIGTAILLAASVPFGGSIPMPAESAVAWSMLYFAVFPSLLAFYAWNQGTARLGPSRAAPYNNLVPVVGGLLGVALLGEAIESYHFLGGGLICLGLMANGLRDHHS